MKVSLYFRNGDVVYCNNCTTMISLWIDEDNHLRNSVGTEHPTKSYPGDCLKDFIIRCDELMDVRSGDEGLLFNAFAAIVVCDSKAEIPDEVKSDAASFYQDLQQHMDVWKRNHSGEDTSISAQSFYGESFEQGICALTCNSADDFQDMMSYLDSCGYILSEQLSPAGWEDFCRYVYCEKITTEKTSWLFIRGDRTPPDTIDKVMSFSDYIKQIY